MEKTKNSQTRYTFLALNLGLSLCWVKMVLLVVIMMQGPWQSLSPDALQLLYARLVDYVSVACVLMPRQLYFDAGAFDFQYEMGSFDLAMALRKMGRQIFYQPSSVVYRQVSGGIESASSTCAAPIFCIGFSSSPPSCRVHPSDQNPCLSHGVQQTHRSHDDSLTLSPTLGRRVSICPPLWRVMVA